MTTEERVRVLPAPRSESPEFRSEEPPDPQPTSKPSSYVSGLCAVGYCYKSKNIHEGRKLPSCQWKYEYRGKRITCTHDCHRQFEDMIKLITDTAAETGADPSFMLPPQLAEAASYVATISDRVLYVPTLTVPSLEERTFGPTPTGRAARGELEDKVRRVILKFIDFPELSTQTIAVMVDRENPPSVGAVHAVLRRWEAKGLCKLASNPFRFDGFTELGKIHLVRN